MATAGHHCPDRARLIGHGFVGDVALWNRALGSCNQQGPSSMERNAKINPALKGWLDRVIIPVLVREYLATHRDLDDNGLSAIHSEDSNSSSPENIQ
jgi:hypothetical protein